MSAAPVDPLVQLEEKLKPEIESGHPYEALQYVQSFVARKKKTLGQKNTSALVFHGAKLLILSGASSEAGTLMVWFIENGAGVEHLFNLENGELTDDKYCDVQRLQALIDQLSVDQAAPFVEKIYGPLHILAAKKNVDKSSVLGARLLKLEETFANTFEGARRWNIAYKSVNRLGDFARLAKILDLWSHAGYKTEQPLYFARAVLLQLADKKVSQAAELVQHSLPYINDNASSNSEVDNSLSGSLAVWHLAVILTDLANLAPMPRVDKTKLFQLLVKLYAPIVASNDIRLMEILDKVGPNVFNFAPAVPQQAAANPMQLLKSMFAGATAPQQPQLPLGANPNGLDMNSIMAMLNQMQGAKR